MPCFYAPQLVPGMKNLTIEGEEFHHIINVFRKKQDDQILLTNGRGLMVTSTIDKISKKNLSVKTVSSQQREKKNPLIAVGFSLLRSKNDHFIVEKLTELGVSEFHPLISQRSVRISGDNTIDKFIKTAIAAIKQCDNPFLPAIKDVKNLEETVQVLQNDGFSVLVAIEREASKLITEIIAEPFAAKIALLFGPEGGFSDEEILMFRSKEAVGFTIGNHVLRAETAAIAGVSQLLLSILQKQPDYF